MRRLVIMLLCSASFDMKLGSCYHAGHDGGEFISYHFSTNTGLVA
jgi:hypothetical protein